MVEGVRKTSPICSITIVDTSTEVYKVTSGRSAKLKKALISNRSASDAWVMFGTYTGTPPSWTQRTPKVRVSATSTLVIGENELPNYEFYTDIYAQSSAQPVELQVEVEEIG